MMYRVKYEDRESDLDPVIIEYGDPAKMQGDVRVLARFVEPGGKLVLTGEMTRLTIERVE